MQLTSQNQNQTMSSRESADLVESRHDNVKVTIRRLADSGVIQLPAMQEVKNEQGRPQPALLLDNDHSFAVSLDAAHEQTTKNNGKITTQ